MAEIIGDGSDKKVTEKVLESATKELVYAQLQMGLPFDFKFYHNNINKLANSEWAGDKFSIDQLFFGEEFDISNMKDISETITYGSTKFVDNTDALLATHLCLQYYKYIDQLQNLMLKFLEKIDLTPIEQKIFANLMLMTMMVKGSGSVVAKYQEGGMRYLQENITKKDPIQKHIRNTLELNNFDSEKMISELKLIEGSLGDILETALKYINAKELANEYSKNLINVFNEGNSDKILEASQSIYKNIGNYMTVLRNERLKEAFGKQDDLEILNTTLQAYFMYLGVVFSYYISIKDGEQIKR